MVDVSYPLVSIVTATFNRANTIERAVNSVLNQSYKNIELIIVDDGSTDNTLEILNKYEDTRIRIFRHYVNKGTLAAKNSGLRQIKGDWFTVFDSDDELIPEAIERLMAIPLFLDATITAVTCNCIDVSTKQCSGKGLSFDQYVDVETLMNCSGEFWGITKTSLLQNDLFNENLRGGMEETLWTKIDDRAKRYYIHSPLRIYHTEGDDRVSKVRYNFEMEIKYYENIINEEYFLNKLKKYRPKEYYHLCRNALIVMNASNNKKIALKYYHLLNTKKDFFINLAYRFRFFSQILITYKNLKVR
jgi:glycosyltransferase involved in cell wall biosynthesis